MLLRAAADATATATATTTTNPASTSLLPLFDDVKETLPPAEEIFAKVTECAAEWNFKRPLDHSLPHVSDIMKLSAWQRLRPPCYLIDEVGARISRRTIFRFLRAIVNYVEREQTAVALTFTTACQTCLVFAMMIAADEQSSLAPALLILDSHGNISPRHTASLTWFEVDVHRTLRIAEFVCAFLSRTSPTPTTTTTTTTAATAVNSTSSSFSARRAVSSSSDSDSDSNRYANANLEYASNLMTFSAAAFTAVPPAGAKNNGGGHSSTTNIFNQNNFIYDENDPASLQF